MGLIAREMGGVALCKDVLVLVPTGHILRGYFIDTTMERDQVYLWRLVQPLYSPLRGQTLAYSKRIPERQKIYIDRNAYPESAQRVCVEIDQDIDMLRALREPHDFLRHVAWMASSTNPRYHFDVALTHCRIGNWVHAHGLIQGLVTELGRLSDADSRRTVMAPHLARALRAIEAGSDAMTALLDEWTEENLAKAEAQKTRIDDSVASMKR